MMSMKRRASLSRSSRIARSAAASRRLHRAAERDFRQARHPGHDVRPRLGGLPARASRAQPEVEKDVKAMRAIAEEAFAMVREYKGSHSGEHGDGIVRSEFHERCSARASSTTFEEVKRHFDPDNLLNPGKFVDPPRNGRPRAIPLSAGLSRRELKPRSTGRPSPAPAAVPGRRRDVQQQRRLPQTRGRRDVPSYRVTREEKDVTRGRANTLRLAISGQLGRTRSPPTR